MASVDWTNRTVNYLNLGAGASATAGPLLAALGDAVQSAMERELSRTFDAASYTEAYDGNGQSALYLIHDPIRTVTAVSLNGTALTVSSSVTTYPPSDVIVHRNRAALVRTTDVWTPGYSNVLVTYTAGLSTADGPPLALVQAGVEWIALLWKSRDRNGIQSEASRGQTLTFTREIPPFVRDVINLFKRGYVPTC